jgi:predicted N-acetyltransferase YhbS
MDDTATVTTRAATPDDVDAILSIWELAAVEAHDALTSPRRATLGAHLRASLRHPRTVVLCALADGRVTGYLTAHVDVHPTMDGAVGVVDELFVHPAARRQGAARALLADGVARLRAKGVQGVRAELHPADDAAASFARTAGFVRGAQRWDLDGTA